MAETPNNWEVEIDGKPIVDPWEALSQGLKVHGLDESGVRKYEAKIKLDNYLKRNPRLYQTIFSIARGR